MDAEAHLDVLLAERAGEIGDLGDSKNAVRGHCLDIPRFDESLNNWKQHKTTFEEQGIWFEEWINRIHEIPDDRALGAGDRHAWIVCASAYISMYIYIYTCFNGV